jgi:branched-chain amino acid transport system ATP-binding protein
VAPLLEVDDVIAGYDAGTVLEGVSLTVETDETVALLGRNGVGKSTTLRTITGLLTPRSGAIRFDGEDITDARPHDRYERGIAMVPEDRGIFPDLTVRENLTVPTLPAGRQSRSLEDLYDFFPKLDQLSDSKGKHLSGGEQQMLSIARVLRSDPELLLLDEPSEGLAPQIVENVKGVIEQIDDEDTTVLIVEQNVEMALEVATSVYIMDAGTVVFEGSHADYEANRDEVERYLGIHEVED